jgi:hypothetical protein
MMILVFGTHGFALTQITVSRRTIQCAVSAVPIFINFLIIYKLTFYIELINEQLESFKELFGKLFEDVPIHIIRVGQRPAKPIDYPTKRLRALRSIYNSIFLNARLINESNGITTASLTVQLIIATVTTGHEWFINSIVRNRLLEHYLEAVYGCIFGIYMILTLFYNCNRTNVLVSFDPIIKSPADLPFLIINSRDVTNCYKDRAGSMQRPSKAEPGDA